MNVGALGGTVPILVKAGMGKLKTTPAPTTHTHAHTHTSHTCTLHTHTHAFPYRKLPRVLDEFKPDMVVYIAGTDILVGDPQGILDITPEV